MAYHLKRCTPFSSTSLAPSQSPIPWDDLLQGFFPAARPNGAASAATPWSPRVDLAETDQGYRLVADVPGYSDADLEITLEDGLLTLKGAHEDTQRLEDEKHHLTERTSRSFERRFKFPAAIDVAQVSAHLEHGVLTLLVPKAPEAKPTKIQVTPTRPQPPSSQ